METRLYRKAFLAISPILIIPAFITLLSCGLLPKNRQEKDIYTILNKELSRIKENEKKDSIFITTGRIDIEYYMPQIVSIVKKIPIYQKRYNIKQTAADSLLLTKIDNISSSKELAHMREQAEIPFEIDLKKISSNDSLFNYKKPIKRLDERGVVIFTREMYADYSRVVYSLSKPVLTSDGVYGMLLVHKRDVGGYVAIYKKQSKQWDLARIVELYVE